MTDHMAKHSEPATKRDLWTLREQLHRELASKEDLVEAKDQLRRELASKSDLNDVELRLKRELARSELRLLDRLRDQGGKMESVMKTMSSSLLRKLDAVMSELIGHRRDVTMLSNRVSRLEKRRG